MARVVAKMMLPLGSATMYPLSFKLAASEKYEKSLLVEKA